MTIKVLVVDDSALIRSLLKEIINQQRDMQVVGTAPDPYAARDLIKSLNPDVLTLDVEMPRMNGLEFLEKLMRLRPMPVVMVSSLTEKNSQATIRALELGAVDFVHKPALEIQLGLLELAESLADKIRIAAKARIKPLPTLSIEQRLSADAVLPSLHNKIISTEKLIIIGASTGGTEAIKEVLLRMPPDCPGIAVTQHMPPGFTKSFAQRLDSLCQISVKEAAHGERILPGHAYIAPGDKHLLVERSGANYVTALSDGPPVNRHKPSVDVLFRSASNCAGKNVIGVILTGMGADGAVGMKEMQGAGAHTIAQDEKSCVVFGMPKAAIEQGGVDEVVALEGIAQAVLIGLGKMGTRAIRI